MLTIPVLVAVALTNQCNLCSQLLAWSYPASPPDAQTGLGEHANSHQLATSTHLPAHRQAHCVHPRQPLLIQPLLARPPEQAVARSTRQFRHWHSLRYSGMRELNNVCMVGSCTVSHCYSPGMDPPHFGPKWCSSMWPWCWRTNIRAWERKMWEDVNRNYEKYWQDPPMRSRVSLYLIVRHIIIFSFPIRTFGIRLDSIKVALFFVESQFILSELRYASPTLFPHTSLPYILL